MIGTLILMNPPRRRRRARVRPRRGPTAREGRKDMGMARVRGRRRGRRRKVGIRIRRRRRLVAPRIYRRRRSHRRRRVLANPLFLSKKGFSRRKHKGYRQLHISKVPFGGPPARRYWHNPRRRRRYAKRNPGALALRRRTRLLSDPIGAVMNIVKDAFSMESMVTVVQAGLGFGITAGGSRLVYRQLLEGLNTPVGRVGTNLGVSLIQSLVLGMLAGPKIATRALTGGLLATAWQGLTEAVRDTKAAEWIPTLGEDADTAAFRKALQREVLREISGGKSASGVSVYLQPAGVSETYLQPAGSQAYLTKDEAVRASMNMGAYLTQKEISNVTGMGDSESEFSSIAAPERF